MYTSFHLIPMLIGIGVMLIGMMVSFQLKAKFEKYSRTQLLNGMSGKEIAEKMLRDHNIYNVKVTCVQGELTDHYNPVNRTVNLSESVYHGRNAAAAAVASHECGHAVQHATAYSMLNLRTKLVPLQNISGTVLNIILTVAIFGGSLLYGTASFNAILYLVIACYGIFALFSLVTLPVEFDASKRALNWMSSTGMVNQHEYVQSKDALKWAALTYVVAAIGSVATLLYYISLLNRNSED